MRRLPRLGLMLAFAALTGCGGDGGQPPTEAGDLTVSYFQGGPTAGALLLTISGGLVESVTAIHNEQVAFSTATPGTTRVVVTGDLGTGILLRVRVPDVSKASQYHITVDQVADKATFSLINPLDYTLTISP